MRAVESYIGARFQIGIWRMPGWQTHAYVCVCLDMWNSDNFLIKFKTKKEAEKWATSKVGRPHTRSIMKRSRSGPLS